MSFQSRLKNLRLEAKLTQQDVANKLGITRQAYGYYESEKSKREPDHDSTQKLARIFDVSLDYLLGATESKIIVANQIINITKEEIKLLNELKKHPTMLHDLASNPEKKIKELVKLYQMKKMLLEEDEGEYGDSFDE
ncbi:helix-turn-helix transcriptional regulator [Sporosarcina sp. 179-K 3D1 HS]|uniref:helix-turn-helix domain-containing protein n=1 Tax=Sporosarcina sp. 179-K 3D1 HS TaxID=3232169 RepID=UPI00399F9363